MRSRTGHRPPSGLFEARSLHRLVFLLRDGRLNAIALVGDGRNNGHSMVVSFVGDPEERVRSVKTHRGRMEPLKTGER